MSSKVGALVARIAPVAALFQVADIESHLPNMAEPHLPHMDPFLIWQVADGFVGVSGGVLRGVGRQALSACVTTVAFWGLAVPLGIAWQSIA